MLRAATQCICVLAVVSMAFSCQRGTLYDLRDPDIALEINGESISAAAVRLLYQPYALAGAMSREEFLRQIIHNRLLHRNAGEPTPPHQHDHAASSSNIDEDEKARALEQYDNFAALLLGKQHPALADIEALISHWNLPNQADNEALYVARSNTRLAARKELDDARARAHIVARYAFPSEGSQTANAPATAQAGEHQHDQDSERALSYYDVYRSAKLEIREAMQRGNHSAMRLQVRTAVRRRYLEHVSGGPERRILADIRAIIEDEHAAKSYELRMGFRRHEHDDGAIGELAHHIAPERIAAHYRAHRDEFTEIAEVRCRHISVADHDTAQAAFRELEDGADFVELVRKYSTAPDRDQAEPGLLSPIENRSPITGRRPFLHTLCLLHAQDQAPIPPMRSREGFELLRIEGHRQRYQSLEQTVVRNRIARHLATLDLIAKRDTELAVLMARARVRINPLMLAPAPSNRRATPATQSPP